MGYNGSMSDQDGPGPALQMARALLGQGQVAAAQLHMEQAVVEADQAHGVGSFEAHVARGELGALLLYLGDHERAVTCFRQAVAFEPGDDQERRKRLLTLRGELAMTLERAGHTSEAAQVYLEGLEQRAAFYGREHAGYAFGLEPYAAFLARRGDLAGALPIAQEAAENLDRNQHPRLAQAVILLAQIHSLQGHPHPFGAMELPEGLVELVGRAIGEQDGWPSGMVLAVIESFLEAASGRLGLDSEGLEAALVAATQAARSAGAHASLARHLHMLLAMARERGQAAEEQHLTMALSLAAEEAGDPLEAERLLREGVRLANELPEPRVRCHALRQLGVFHAHHRRPEAESVLRTALLEAISCDDRHEADLTRVALGVHLQHEGRPDEARELLSLAVEGLDPATSQAFTARGHLDAIAHGSGCGCGRGEQAYTATLESLVRPELPDDLLEAIEIEDGQLSVKLRREPSSAEAELLDRVLRQALFRLRKAAEK